MTATYSVDGGSAVASETVDNGETITEPTDPTKAGFTFDAWYTEAELTNEFDFSTPLTDNITLYAGWTE